MSTNPQITVVLVDDSSVIRNALRQIINADPEIEIIDSVANGELAIQIAARKKPDVMLLDVEMPTMNGLTALPKVLEHSPDTKVIMCSSLTAKGADTTIKAMALGAVECLVKPSSAQNTGQDSEFSNNLLTLIKSLGGVETQGKTTAKTIQPASGSPSVIQKKHHDRPSSITLKRDSEVFQGKPEILAIGSSTGGPQALFNVLGKIGTPDIPIVITQHMPATFTKILADHITQHTGLETHEGTDHMPVEKGKVYVAPGGKHMVFKKTDKGLVINLNDGPQENFCKPSVEPMMRSLIDYHDKKILCVILTGMGSDGLHSARILSEKGGRIIAQDKATSVVWGMPGAVANDGICNKVLPLDDIGPFIKKIIQ